MQTADHAQNGPFLTQFEREMWVIGPFAQVLFMNNVFSFAERDRMSAACINSVVSSR